RRQADLANQSAFLAEARRQDAVRARAEADATATTARAGQLAATSLSALADTRLDLALLLGVEAIETEVNGRTRDALLSALTQHPRLLTLVHGPSGHGRALDAAYSPDGSMLATVSFDGSITLW